MDYKYAFSRIDTLIKTKKNTIILDAWYDRVEWYLPSRKFGWLLKSVPYKNIPIAYNTQQFKSIKSNYKSGIVIIENWESLTPPELQNHIRKTLKHEFDVNNLPYNEKDMWSISIYSWGL